MKLRNRIIAVLLLVAIIFSTVGCAKCVGVEYESVEVTVVDEYHRGVFLTPIITGKVTTFVTHPAVYRITVEYDGAEYTVNGSDTYYDYKDKIGQIVIGELEIATYDDGSVKYNIVGLE